MLISFVVFAQHQEQKIDTVSQIDYKSFSFNKRFSIVDKENKRFSLLNMRNGETTKSIQVKSSQPRVPIFPIIFTLMYFIIVTYFLAKVKNKSPFLIKSTAVSLLVIIFSVLFKLIVLEGDMFLIKIPTILSVATILLSVVIGSESKKVFYTLFSVSLVGGLIFFLLKGTLLVLVPPMMGFLLGFISLKMEKKAENQIN